MGFWHTGYLEHHEERGLGITAAPDVPAPVFGCDICSREFSSETLLREHRFAGHPKRQPVLLYRGVPLGYRLHVFTSCVSAADLLMLDVSSVRLNGVRLTPSAAIGKLAAMRQGRARLFLDGASLSSRELDFEFDVPNTDDLQSVEDALRALVGTRRLDHQSIGDFIARTEDFRSAGRLRAAIADYFFGVILKEGREESGDGIDYREKWNDALDRLATINHPVSIEFRAIINFHFNLFLLSASVPTGGAVSMAARKFARSLGLQVSPSDSTSRGYGDMFLDRDTSQICKWALMETLASVVEVESMERFIRGPATMLDKVKVRVLLAEHYVRVGERRMADRHLREMTHDDSGFGRWALQLSRGLEET
jgi:hypothetical protein